MTELEAIEKLDDLKELVPEEYVEAIQLTQKALLKQIKLHWHNLQRNPKDLPKNKANVLVLRKRTYSDKYRDYKIGTYLPTINKWDFNKYEEDKSHPVIAWQEIDLFEV